LLENAKVPGGGEIQLVEDGSAIILDAAGEWVSIVDSARRAQRSRVVYPVTADCGGIPVSWFRAAVCIAANVWNDSNKRRQLLISTGCSLAAAGGVATLFGGPAGVAVSRAISIGITSYNGCSILARQ